MTGAFVVFTLFFVLLCVAFARSAQAAPETIAGLGQGAGEVSFPVGTAVHQASGDLYVADRNNNRIVKFHSDGEFALAWGFGVRDGATEELQTCGPEATPPQSWCFGSLGFSSNNGAGNISPASVAVDQASGDVYVSDTNKRRITKFSSSGQFVFLVGKDVNATKVALGGGATQAEKNICTAASGDICTIGASGTGANEFVDPRSLAITQSGIVWVGDTNGLKSFDSTGTPGAEIALAGAGNTLSLAINSEGDFYVKSASLVGVRKLARPDAPVPGELLQTLDAAGQPLTVTLDAADNIYVGDATSPYRFLMFKPAGDQVSQFGAGEVIGAPGSTVANGANALAVGEGAKTLYVASSGTGSNSAVQSFPLPKPGPLVEKQGAEDLLPTAATLTARINPENDETTYRFEYGTSEGYGEITPIKTLAVSGFEGEDVEAQLAGLLPDTTYHFRVVATNHCNPSELAEVCTAEGEDRTFTTPPAVVIDPQWATDITAHSAVLHAKLDPLGVEAEAWLEYGNSESYGQTVSLANLGEGFGSVTRQASITGLQAAAVYHYRFVARDERDGIVYTVQGPDRTFITQFGGLGFALADNRVWEMVSPPDKHGARLVGGGEIHLQASAEGDGLAYQSVQSTEADPEGNRIPETSMNLAHRDDDGSWRSQDITPPNDRLTPLAIGNGSEYKLFTSDLSEALVAPRSGTPLSAEASERTPYLRENTTPPAYGPLVTGKEPFANVPPGIEFGGKGNVPAVAIAGASSDFRHVALVSGVPLVEGVAVSGQTAYEWSNGQIKPVSVLPADEGGALVGANYVGSGNGSVQGAVSEDGSRVFWSPGVYPSFTALYVRDTEAEESARLDVVQPGASGIGTAQPVFQGASADGSVVFFTDSRQLTENAGSHGLNLYRCELPSSNVASGCATLTSVSVPAEAGGSAEVEGIAPGVAEDAQAIYFVARGVLDEAANESGDSAVSDEPNLYVWKQGEGVRFIATLSEEDETVWGKASEQGGFASPGGRYLAFMSQRSLTGYDNRDATTGEPAQELFRYDVLVDRLECVSCNPTGARPHSTAPEFASLVNPQEIWKGRRTSATLPQAVSIALHSASLYHPRAVLDNGRVFFNAVDPLVPADSNGQWDVYQYEPTGLGDCLASSGGASISRVGGGCVSLISSGTAEEEAAFFDASETGDDVFFFTPARLSVFDEDDEVDVYDARVDGIKAVRPVNAECLGEACQPLAQAPNDPTPASAAFHGPGNLRPAAGKSCPKGKRRVQRKGKTRCVARKHRKASPNRRAGR